MTLTREDKMAIGGWSFAFVMLAWCVYLWIVTPAYVPPPISFWPTEPFTVNTAQIVSMERAGVDGTRIWFGGRRAQYLLFAEQPSYFEGPTRIVTATRIREFNQ